MKLLLAAALLFAGCASPFVLLVNPKNGTTVECSGMGRGMTSAIMVSNQVDNCVRADKLTEEQRNAIDVQAPEKQHRAVSIPPIVIPTLSPALNCTSNRIGESTYTNCH